jgi:hypothetical protein
MEKLVKGGSTNVEVVIRIVDNVTGLPETGVEHNSTGIDMWYRREGAAQTSITEAALAALTTAHTDGGIEHIGHGYYRLDVPDAAFAIGVDSVMIGGHVDDMQVIGCLVSIVGVDMRTEWTEALTESALVDAIWDESAGTHVATGSTGEALREPWEAAVWRRETAQAGANGSITLDASALATDDIYVGSYVTITANTGKHQRRLVTAYNGTTKVATITPDWVTNPNSASIFSLGAGAYGFAHVDSYSPAGLVALDTQVDTALANAEAGLVDAIWDEDILAAHNTADTAGNFLSDLGQAVVVRHNTAQAGTTTTITLDASASAVDAQYGAMNITLVGGTGAGQANTIIGYVGSSKLATVDRGWAVTPDATTIFAITAGGIGYFRLDSLSGAGVIALTDAMWDEPTSGHSIAGTFGQMTEDIDAATALITLAAINAEVDTAIADGEASIVSAVWDKATASHLAEGTAGAAMAAMVHDSATAQAGGAATITLESGASASDNAYNGLHLSIIDGTGIGQTRRITDYAGSTKIATVTPNWHTQPDATSVYALVASGFVDVYTHSTTAKANINAEADTALADGEASIAALVWDQLKSAHTIADSFGDYLDDEISSRSDFNELLNPVELLNSGGSAGTSAAELVVDMAVPNAAAINAEVDTALADAKAGYVDAIWDEDVVAAHNTADTAGKLLSDIDTATANATPTAATTAALVWDQLKSAHTIADSFGDYLDDEITSRSTFDPTATGVELLNSGGSAGTSAAELVVDMAVPNAAAINAEVDTALSDAKAGYVDAIWDEDLVAAHNTADTAGKLFSDLNEVHIVRRKTAQSGASGNIRLDASASSIDDFYNNMLVTIVSATGIGQTRTITDYTGSTTTADVTPNWVTAPDVTSIFIISPQGEPTVTLDSLDTTAIADAVWDAATSSHADAGSFGLAVADIDGATANATPTAATTAALVWDQLKSAHTIADSFGDYLDDEISSRSDFDETTDPVELLDSGGSAGTSAAELVVDMAVPNAAAINAEVDTALADAKAGYVDAIWDEDVVAAHNTADTAGKLLSDIDTATANATPTAATTAAAVWNALKSAHTTPDTFGDYLDDEISSRSDFNEATDPVELLDSGGSAGTSAAELVVDMAVPTTAQINAEVDTALSDAQAGYVDAIWDEDILAAHNTADTAGKMLSDLAQLQVIRRNTAQAGASTTITLDASASATTALYIGSHIVIASGTGQYQRRLIVGYNGSTKVATISPTWAVTPDSTSVFVIGAGGYGYARLDSISGAGIIAITDAIWDEATSGHTTGGTYGLAVADIDTSTANATPTAATIADAVWDELTSGHAISGSFGEQMQDIDTAAAAASTHSAADVWAVGTRDITGGTIDTVGDKTGYALSTAGVDAIWDEDVVAAHNTSDTAGKLLSDIDTATANATPTAATIAALVWDQLKSAHTIADSFGDYLDDEISSRSDFNEATDPVELLDSGGSAGTSAAELVVDMAVPNAAAINAEVDTALADAKAGYVDAIWDELAAGHTTTNTFGDYLDAEVSAIDTTTTPTVAEISDGVWNETASGHVSSGTTGEFLRDGHDAAVVRRSTATAGATGSITLDASASTVNDYYNDSLIVTVSGTGSGQARTIADYVGSSKVASVTPNWITTPDATTVFLITPSGSTPIEIDLTADTTAIAAAVWDEAASGHTTGGTFGKYMDTFSTNIDATMSSRSDFDETSDPVELLDSGGSAGTSAAELVVDLAVPTAATIADAVWNESQSGHTNAGSFGLYLDAVVSNIDTTTTPTVALIADAVWDELTAAHAGAGTFGLSVASAASASAVADAVLDELITDHTTTDTFGWMMNEIKEKTDLITTGTVTVTTPVTSTNAIVLVQGDEYANADSRALSFSSTGWPDLTGSTVTLTANEVRGTGTMSVSGTLSSVGGATQTIYFEPTAVQTAALTLGQDAYKFGVQAVLQTSSNRVTLITSYITVNEDQ